ncbi:isoflavone reductase family protein [Diplodia corticola]|uniref:Isoflavone reductase family protein n=1 Tax=Diplodia corticola TaxID=236234 RepID=A0A1J9S1I9_9PEZI|nr:isoflavone reductase family protein [Diplodia corticola]OJD33525.1 isoflavone reductase family protein [Diplodia corticola]
MELKNIAIVGAGGNIGKHLVPLLLSSNRFHITALTRGTYHPPDPRVRVIAVDYASRASLADALRGQDAVLSLVPGGQVRWDAQKRLVDASVDAGVRLFVPSEFVTDVLTPQYAVFPASFVGDKVALRGYLEELAEEGRIAWAALNGGPFFDMCECFVLFVKQPAARLQHEEKKKEREGGREKGDTLLLRKLESLIPGCMTLGLLGGPAGFDIARRKATIYGTGNNLACWTPLPTIAAALLNMLLHPSRIANKAVFICGVKGVTQNALLAALEAELGESFDVERVDIKKMKAEALELLEKGEVKKAMRGLTLSGQFNEEGSAANFWDKVENELVGVEPVGVREAVRQTLEAANLKERVTSDSWDNE